MYWAVVAGRVQQCFPTTSTAVDPVAVTAQQGSTHQKNVQALWLEPINDPRGAPFENVTVLDESGQGKYVVAEVRHARNVSQQHVHVTVPGPKAKAGITISFDRASCVVGDEQVLVAFFVIGHAVC